MWILPLPYLFFSNFFKRVTYKIYKLIFIALRKVQPKVGVATRRKGALLIKITRSILSIFRELCTFARLPLRVALTPNPFWGLGEKPSNFIRERGKGSETPKWVGFRASVFSLPLRGFALWTSKVKVPEEVRVARRDSYPFRVRRFDSVNAPSFRLRTTGGNPL